MAELNVFVQDLENELTCQICNDIFTAPKSLSCMHSYCFECIQQWIQKCRSEGKKVTCPACNSTEEIEDASKLRSTFWIASLLQLLKTMRNSAGNQQEDQQELPNCISCMKQEISVAFCPQCEGMICSECVNAHKTFKTFVDEHQATMLCDFKKENMSCYIKNRAAFCQDKFHEKDKLQYYCRTCSKCICQRCSSTSTHKLHDTIAIEVAAEEAKVVLKQNTDRLNKVKENYISELELSKQNIMRIKREIDAAKTNVHAKVEAQIGILREHEDNMVKSLDEILVEQKTSNNEEQADIETSIKDISEYQRITQKFIQEDDILLFIVQTEDNLPQICESLLERQSVLSSKPSSRNASVQYVPNLVHNFGKIVNCVTDPGHCSVEGLSEFRCGFNNEFQIVTRNSEDELWYTFIDDINVQIQDNSGKEVENEVKEIETGKYRVQYKPEKPAKHKVTVNICGKPVKRSPYNVKPLNVKAIHLEHEYSFYSFGEVNPVNQMIARNRLDKPFSLALSEKGRLAIADYNKGRIIICSIEGKNVTQFYGKASKEEGQLNYPWGVAFNGEHLLVMSDHPIVKGRSKGRLQEFDIKGIFHREICTQKDVMLRGVCVSDETIAVCCESQNKVVLSGIKLFEKETGQLLQAVCVEENEIPMHIAYGYGKYFVSYSSSNTVRIFDDEFSFEHKFGKKGDRDGQFDSVGGLAAYGPDAILVCDSQNHRVLMFTRKGKFVKAFGIYGLTAGKMGCPSDVVVSQNGEVLVLQCLSGAVTVWK